MNLERVQRGLVAAVAATCLVSIFAAEFFLALAATLYLARLVRGSARLEHLPLDGPLLAFTVWSILSAAFAPDPLAAHRSVKQLVLFSLLYLAVDTLRDEETRERVIDAALLGGMSDADFRAEKNTQLLSSQRFVVGNNNSDFRTQHRTSSVAQGFQRRFHTILQVR